MLVHYFSNIERHRIKHNQLLTRTMGSFVSKVRLRRGGASSATAFAEDRLLR